MNGFFVFVVVLHRDSYLHMQCDNYNEPVNPELECKFGHVMNECNKTSCLKGPDEECHMGGGVISERCAGDMSCMCGSCFGCIGDPSLCSNRICDGNSMTEKRASSKPLWFLDYYQQRQEEKRRLQQHIQQQQQLEERQRQRLMPQTHRDFIKTSANHHSYYPINNNFEFSTNNDD